MDALIRVNNTKESPLEFDVNIQGISVDDPNNAAQVRFVITNVLGGELMFPCEKSADSATKWTVNLPALTLLKPEENAHTFRVEVIIDGYYFEPACGNLILLKNPEVTLARTDKPKVTVAVTAAVSDEKKPEEKAEEGEEKKEQTKEGMGQSAGDIQTVNVAPNTRLLKPEFAPEVSNSEKYGSLKSNVHAVDVVYGDNDDEEGLDDEETDDEVESIADKIVKQTLGTKLKKPEKSGFLFNRTGGKVVVEGIEPDAETKKVIAAKQKKVKDILAGK